ncbi:hypothetical protein [Methylobacterium sp. WCS2018Hpa-22]|jgi:hypothetical protein|uniref:hypothetical protein n=1 Tax=Methylobacterium sp. WCS2018Hpa-22 TaxID=3073633 RepID=UPI002889B9CD|nr:hypothetical protein [Methylobacterium sp. WCS2018Hpa-22]
MGEVVTLLGNEPGSAAPNHVYGSRAGIDVGLITVREEGQADFAVALLAPDTFGIRVLARFAQTPAGRGQADDTGTAVAEALHAFAWHEAVGGPTAYILRGGTIPGLM